MRYWVYLQLIFGLNRLEKQGTIDAVQDNYKYQTDLFEDKRNNFSHWYTKAKETTAIKASGQTSSSATSFTEK